MYQNGKNIIFTDRSVDSVNSFLRIASRSQPLTYSEEYELWVRIRQGSQKAREQLVNANLRYVVKVAKKYLVSKAPFEDLLMAGCEGIIKAADRFDATLGFRFISYATKYIENEVRKTAYDHLRHDASSLDEPVDVEKKDGDNQIDFLYAEPCDAPDWALCYEDAFSYLKERADKRLHGAGSLLNDLYQMLQNGYTTSDFAHKHHLNSHQMKHLLSIFREEAADSFRQSA